jgi:hypothetical protein
LFLKPKFVLNRKSFDDVVTKKESPKNTKRGSNTKLPWMLLMLEPLDSLH